MKTPNNSVPFSRLEMMTLSIVTMIVLMQRKEATYEYNNYYEGDPQG
jgi:hypothetical protein